ncbi:hypothetical protein [Peptoniphilus sp.]|uniref:hypothetical protein n=1 Tax=Peptoniphilus sp. TaxID=1971214 RepID=UPI003D8A9A31
MGLFDNFDDNITDLKENISFLSQKVISESKKIKKIAKVKYEILNEERKIDELYSKVGEHFYKSYKGRDESIDLDEIFKEIDRLKSRVSSLKMHLELEGGEESGLYVDKSFSNENNFSDDYKKEDESYKIITIKEDEDEFR